MYRVVFPFELKLPNTTDDAAGRDALYSLFAVVVHVGSGPHHGEGNGCVQQAWRGLEKGRPTAFSARCVSTALTSA